MHVVYTGRTAYTNFIVKGSTVDKSLMASAFGWRQGDKSVYTHSWGNVHDLQAESPVCILLNLVLGPHAEIQRSWYFPVSPLRQHESRVLATRVNGSDRSSHKKASGDTVRSDRA